MGAVDPALRSFVLFVIPAKAGIQFLLSFCFFGSREQELPLSCGQRVTFFAGAKKVTKETPSRI
jgi:hypothetical protein